jgi:hypothetical protein
MSAPSVRERPGTVTAVVVLTYLAGIFDVIAGGVIWALAGNNSLQEASGQAKGALTTVAIVYIVLGAVTILVGFLLAQGSPVARMLVTILMVLRIGAAVYGLIVVGLSGATESIIAIVIAVTVVALLWNQRATEYFNSPRA